MMLLFSTRNKVIMVLRLFNLVMVQVCPFTMLVMLLYVMFLPTIFLPLIIFYMYHLLTTIFSAFLNLLVIMEFSLNFFLTIAMSKIRLESILFFKEGSMMAFMCFQLYTDLYVLLLMLLPILLLCIIMTFGMLMLHLKQ